MNKSESQQSQKCYFVKMELAGIKIEANFNSIDDLACCKGYLKEFDEADFSVFAPNEDISLTTDEFRVQNNYNDFGNILGVESQIIYERLVEKMISFDTFLMHGSVVAKDGYAYMFTAASGVGKTTRTKLFLDLYPDSIVVNGDKPLIKITETSAIACGTPWCGKEGWNTNTMVPLKAIYLLERTDKGEESSIEEISLGKAFPFLLQQTHRPEDPDLMRKTLQLLKSLEGKVKIYRFHSTPTEDSVRLAYETARSC